MKNNVIVEIPIIRRNFDNTNSAKFKGTLKIVSNEHGIIKDWKINFCEVYIDLFTTSSWFTKPNTTFKIRKLLFDELGFSQKPRPKESANDILKLNEYQIEKLNAFLNDRSKYKSTIKNIVGVLKGNNPGGEAKNPKSAEMVIDNENSNIENFVILLDDLMFEYNDYFDAYAIGARSISLEEFANINSSLKSAFEFMQKSKDKNGFKVYLEKIKNYYKTFNDWSKQGNQIANNARKKYAKNVMNNIEKDLLPFEFTNYTQFQKCHIYEFHTLRDKIIDSLIKNNDKDVKKYESMICDHENFIPLPEEIHRQFDRHIFTYNLDGTVRPITEEGYNFVSSMMDTKFKTIDSSFLTSKRKYYIKERNKEINFLE